MEDPTNHPTIRRKRVHELVATDYRGEDRISDLPENVLLHILSSLPTEKTISTAILSKKWKSLWKKLPNLKFESKHHQNMFSEHLISALLSYHNRDFESLTIGVSNKCDAMDVAIWLAIAFAKHVSKLVLRLNKVTQPVTLSDGMLNHRNTLKILKLMGNIILKNDYLSVSLNCLKELHLYHVRFASKSSVTHLLRGCPVLEDLVLVIHITSGVTKVIIDHQSLLHLTLGWYDCQEENVVIKTPLLTHLNIQKFDGVGSCHIKNAPSLLEAKIARHQHNMEENILASVSSAQFLALTAPLKLPVAKRYDDLITLEIDTKSDEWCNLLSVMLNSSPRLRALKLVGGLNRRWFSSWVEPQCIPTCLTSHLHTLEWEVFIWDAVDDLNIAIYILKNSAQLKKASFTTTKPNTAITSQERQHLLDQLASVPRASARCHTEFKDYYSNKAQIDIGEDDPDVGYFSG